MIKEAISKVVALEDLTKAEMVTVMEEVMLDLMYDLPDVKVDAARYVLDSADIAEGKSLAELRMIKKESA